MPGLERPAGPVVPAAGGRGHPSARAQACRGELDRQRDAVEAAAHGHYLVALAWAQRDVPRAREVDEQFDGVRLHLQGKDRITHSPPTPRITRLVASTRSRGQCDSASTTSAVAAATTRSQLSSTRRTSRSLIPSSIDRLGADRRAAGSRRRWRLHCRRRHRRGCRRGRRTSDPADELVLYLVGDPRATAAFLPTPPGPVDELYAGGQRRAQPPSISSTIFDEPGQASVTLAGRRHCVRRLRDCETSASD